MPGDWEPLTEDGGVAVRYSKKNVEARDGSAPNKRARVAYTGALDGPHGAVFDSSGGYAIWFPLGEGKLIEGWERALADARPGDEFELRVSPQYGYGDTGSGAEVRPGSTLLFTVRVEETEARPAVSAKAALKEQRAAATKASEEAAAKRAAAQAETDARKAAAAARAAEMASKRAGGGAKGGKPKK